MRIDHAFAIWTQRIGTWWPADHTVSGDPAAVVLEGRVGGRIYERTRQGEEHDWGVVTDWRPPDQLSYRWHLGVGPEAATDVAVSSRAGDGARPGLRSSSRDGSALASRARTSEAQSRRVGIARACTSERQWKGSVTWRKEQRTIRGF